MRIVPAAVIVLALAAGRAFTILQVDVPEPVIPTDCQGQLSATMRIFDNPTVYPHTDIFGPDGFPLVYHLIFDYDGTLQGGAVDRINLQAGEVVHSWLPEPMTVAYPQGPAFPVAGDFEAFPSCTTGIDPMTGPASAMLESIQPNPCNPDAVVTFQTNVAGDHRLGIHDLTGRRVALLLDSTLPAGRHSATFHGGAFASGLYLVVLESGERSEARRLLLLK